jgi:hypothetical protein
MEKSQPEEWSQLFLVRMWQDQVAGGQSPWRGKVQHVATGKGGLFDDWASLVDLLTSLAHDPNQPGAELSRENSFLEGAGTPSLAESG